jgi:2-dehydro-3-deoxygluconokinase
MKRLAFIGECMIELSDAGGETGATGALRRGFGGDTLNSAVYAARCLKSEAAAVDYVTILGDDPFSDEMLAAWRAEGLGTGLIARKAGALPGLYLIRTDAAGERSFHYWRGEAPARALFADDGAAALSQALVGFDLIYFSGITLAILSDAGRARLYETLAQVRARGGQVAFDPNYRPRLWPDAAAARREIARGAEAASLVLTGLDDERALYGDTAPEASAERLHGLGAAEVVVRNGGADCLISLGGERFLVSPPLVARPVDTTAAGDSFNAAYLARHILGTDAMEAARRACDLAARVIQHRGAVVAAP